MIVVPEKNRNTLLRALRELPEYEPPDGLWDELGQRLDRERAEAPLRCAIRELPDHYPPAALWENLHVQLDRDQSERTLRQAIAELPSHHPPAELWEDIAAGLPPAEDTSSPRPRVIALWQRPALAAGITALLCALAWWTFTPGLGKRASISYSTIEVVPLGTDQDDQEMRRDEEAFELVLGELAVHPLLGEDPEIQMLKEELVELDAAREQLQTAISHYGRDAEMEQRMTRIEHERGAVLLAMIAKI